MCIAFYRSNLDADFPPTAMEAKAGPNMSPSEKVKVRKNFPETWLWQALDAG